MTRLSIVFLLAAISVLPTLPAQTQHVDSTALLSHVKELSSDIYKGRAAGSTGNQRARAYIKNYFKNLNLDTFEDDYLSPFDGGVNIIGYIKGTENPNTYIVVTAHFDHLGVQNGQIYNGADDNASGTSALMEMAAYLKENPLNQSIIFAALDAEEQGLKGAKAFVKNPPVEASTVALNVNMDMISHNDKNELYAAGTYHYPFLKPYLQTVAKSAEVKLLFGHDIPGTGHDDWTNSSDHAPFHQEWNLPFIYFGVEDHPDYHRPTDDFENINPSFFVDATVAILASLIELDANLPAIMKQSKRN